MEPLKTCILIGLLASFVVGINADGKCVIKGDPHVLTFDKYNYRATGGVPCEHYLVKHDNFNVIGRLVECRKPGTTCLDRIRIDYQGESWILEQESKVTDDVGTPLTLPFESSNGIAISKSGNKVEAVLPNGVKVIWNGNRKADILVTDQFRNALDGMCGDFDGNAGNDSDAENDPDKYKVDMYCPSPYTR